jgi:hypothetical protein
MRFSTALEYLDLGATKGTQILNKIPAITFDDGKATVRPERHWLREDLDLYLEGRKRVGIKGRNQEIELEAA